MKGIKMGKTLYGGVEKNEFNYEWKAEPGACEVCQELDGTVYETSDEIPSKPHPNCKCWINLVQKESPTTTDPIEIRREQAKDRKRAQFELEKLLGDVKVLQDEVDAYVNDLENKNNEFEEIEKELNIKKLPTNDTQFILKTKNDIKSSINTGEKIAKELSNTESQITTLQESISNKSTFVDSMVKRVKTLYQEFMKEIQKKEALDKCIDLVKDKMSVSAALWKLSSSKFQDGLDYVNKNGKIYNSTEEIKDKKTREFVKNKIKQQFQSKNSKGVIFNSNSELADKLANSKALKSYIKNNSKKFLPNTTLPNTSLEFDLTNLDLYNALHRADIIDIKIDESGEFSAKVIDTYDFNPNSKNPLVKRARIYQERGEIENYYSITIIKIPQKVWKKYK